MSPLYPDDKKSHRDFVPPSHGIEIHWNYCLPSSDAVTLKSPQKLVFINVSCIIAQDGGHAKTIKLSLWRSIDIWFMSVAHEGQVGHMTSSSLKKV